MEDTYKVGIVEPLVYERYKPRALSFHEGKGEVNGESASEDR
jgi:hypothetical protein